MQATTTPSMKKHKATITIEVEVFVDKEETQDYVEQLIENAIEIGQREVGQKGVEEVWFDYSNFSINFHR
jgi:hypothetical protein